MITLIRYLLVSIFALWPSLGLASGWNDFEREIGYGFRIWKTDSFSVCLSFKQHSAIVCGDTGDYGPISGYAFTDKHLLVRTTGTKPSEHFAMKFTSDWSREYFFIVKKRINNPYGYSPVGPLERAAFHANPAVPAQIQWKLPSRFEEVDTSRPAGIVVTIIAWLVVFGPIFILPIIVLLVAWRMYRWMRPKV